MTQAYKDRIREVVAEKLATYQDHAKAIYERPEVCNTEYFASDLLANQLRHEGFEVTQNIAGHETGFVGVYRASKPGPVLAFLAEYDALPGIGHACGHNLFGNYSLLAAVALKSVIDDLGGEIRVYGTPGEEGGENGSAKGSYVKAGFFQDVDAALCAHPAHKFAPTLRLLANAPVDIEFFGRASHAAGAPEAGISALEALIQVFNSINALRLNLTKDVNIHGIITNGGQAANVIPEYASGRFYLRAAERKTLESVYQKVENIVKGAALATGCDYKFGLFQNWVDDVVPTPLFDQLFFQEVADYGIDESEIERSERNSLGSSDVGNVSQVVPTIQPTVSISDSPIPGHSEEFKAAAGSPKGYASIAVAATLLANTALALLLDPEKLAVIKAQHQSLTQTNNN